MKIIRKNLKALLLVLGLTVTGMSWAQVISLSGRVTDADTGEPLPGVTVVVKGTTNGTITSSAGIYNLSVEKGATLQFSYIGYKAIEQVVGESPTINVALHTDLEQLEEVVVIGYGQVKKKDATGSVTAVSSDDFNKGAITSPQDLIIGKTAGVIITSGDGAPGSAATIRIRGGSSMSASNDPLIVIDGVPVDNDGISGMSNPLASINPNDIESFTVLKDASATAIYGSRASNGVIIITTKKGGGKFKVSYNGTASVYTVGKTIEVLNADEYKTLVSDLYGVSSTAYSLLGSADTDWQDQIYQTAIGQDHNVNFSGSAKNLPYRVSLGYTNQDGILKTSNIDRTTADISLNPSFFDNYLHVNLNFKGVYNKSRFANTSAIGAAIQFDPTHPVKDDNSIQEGGYYAWMSGNTFNSQAVSNPVAMINLTHDISKIYRSIGNLQLDYKLHFLPDMKANLNLAYDYSKTDGNKYVPANTTWTTSFKGTQEAYSQRKRMQLLEFYLNYGKDIAPLESKIDVTAGYSWQHFWNSTSDYATSADGTTVNDDTSSKSQNYLISFFGRLNYSWKERYLLTFTLRDDGSSRFAADNRWGLFPSLALAWKIKDESFLKNNRMISDLKLRLGYGVTGQQDIGDDYPYLATYSRSTDDETAQYQFGDTFYDTLRPNGYDENIKWESTTTYNAGIDFGFLKDRITGSLDYYYRETNDLLNTISVPEGSNLTNEITTNVGNLNNTGLEFSINTKIISKKDIMWEIAYNLSYNKNKITKLTAYDDPTYKGVETGSISGGTGNTVQINSVGYPVKSFYVYQQVYDKDGKPVEGLYVDRNNDGIINTDDLYRYKKADPDVLMGLSSRFYYKNWDCSFSARVSLGNYVYNNVASNYGTYYNVYNGGTSYLSNVVKQSEKSQFQNAQYLSDFYVENGSFFRMDNVSLGYQFKDIFDGKSSLHLSAMVQNVFVITKYNGLDPEIYGGIDNNLYPRPRTFVLGVNLDF